MNKHSITVSANQVKIHKHIFFMNREQSITSGVYLPQSETQTLEYNSARHRLKDCLIIVTAEGKKEMYRKEGKGTGEVTFVLH
jgi:hypothetical protein